MASRHGKWFDNRQEPDFDHWSLSDGHPQPRICGSNEGFLVAHLDMPPPPKVATNDNIPWAAVVKIPRRPKSCWLVTECRMIACDPEDPTNKDTNIPLTTLSGGWNYPNTDTLYFFFENVTFPKAGIFRVKFEIVMMGYRDRYDRPHENDYYPFLKSNFWNYEDIPDEEKMEEYKKTGFRAGVLVAGEDTIVSDEPDWRGMNDPANWISGKSAKCTSSLTPSCW